MEISVVVPIYNLSDVLDRLVAMFRNQTFTDFELLLINDGSTDETESVLAILEDKNDFVNAISTKNQGQAAARNLGVKNARGKYVTFVDADDYVSSDYLSILFDAINYVPDADIATVQHADIFEASDIPETKATGKKASALKVFTGLEAVERSFRRNGQFLDVSIWGKIYKTNFIFERPLIEGHYFEDLAFVPKLLADAQKVVVSKAVAYYYLNQRSGSTVTSYSEKKSDDLLWALEYLEHDFLSLIKNNKRLIKSYQIIKFNNLWMLYNWNSQQNEEVFEQLVQVPMFDLIRGLLFGNASKQGMLFLTKTKLLKRKSDRN